MNKIIFKTICIILVCNLCIAPIWAAGGIQATPPDFKYNLNPGDTTTSQITLINTGNIPLQVEIIGKRLHIWNNHLDYNNTGIAQWITIYPSNFTLQPYEQRTISFNLKIPTDIDYNDALGALLIHSSIPDSNLLLDLVIPLQVHIAGTGYKSLDLINHSVDEWLLSGTKDTISYELRNNGTIKTNITTTTSIKGLTGEYQITNNTMTYPGDNIVLNNIWQSNLWDFGIFQCNTTIQYNNRDENTTISFQDTTIIIPTWLLILLGILITGYIIYKRK